MHDYHLAVTWPRFDRTAPTTRTEIPGRPPAGGHVTTTCPPPFPCQPLASYRRATSKRTRLDYRPAGQLAGRFREQRPNLRALGRMDLDYSQSSASARSKSSVLTKQNSVSSCNRRRAPRRRNGRRKYCPQAERARRRTRLQHASLGASFRSHIGSTECQPLLSKSRLPQRAPKTVLPAAIG